MFGRHMAGIYEKALKPEKDWNAMLSKAKTLGFDFIELSIDETDERLARLYWDGARKEALRRAAYENGIAISSMCLSAHRRFPFGSSDPFIRMQAQEIMERAIDFAFQMGIRVIQLAGYDVYYEPSTPQSAQCFREALCRAADRAAEKQVMLAVEIMDTPFLNSVKKFLPYEAAVNSPWLKLYPDMGNVSAWEENSPDEEFALGISSIVGVHVKDARKAGNGCPGTFKCVPFGSGCVDFSRRFGQLERLGYTGPYLIEMWYEEGTDDMEKIREAQTWLEGQYWEGIAREGDETGCWKN